MSLPSHALLKAGAMAAALMAGVAAAPGAASAADGYDYGDYGDYAGDGGRTVTRCDHDGDKCATYQCDAYGYGCVRQGEWRLYGSDELPRYRDYRGYGGYGGYGYGGYGGYGYGRTVTRCDSDGDNCVTYPCDEDRC
jgi:hypothetical protein